MLYDDALKGGLLSTVCVESIILVSIWPKIGLDRGTDGNVGI